LKYLKQADAIGVPLLGICTGVFTLHQAGLLDGYKCCVSWFHDADFLGQFDGLNPVSDQIFVVDRNRLTCSGGVSSAHLAAYLVDKHVGRSAASKSLHIMIIDGARPPEEPQPGIPIDFRTNDPIVKRALLIMQQNLETPISVAEISSKMGVGKRQIERHFKSALGKSPQNVFLKLRLSMASHLILSTSNTMEAISAECGFCDSSHMSRLFRREYDCSPLDHRNNHRSAAG
jgi:transcriptional regulator GlxA family with amidase domain